MLCAVLLACSCLLVPYAEAQGSDGLTKSEFNDKLAYTKDSKDSAKNDSALLNSSGERAEEPIEATLKPDTAKPSRDSR